MTENLTLGDLLGLSMFWRIILSIGLIALIVWIADDDRSYWE